MSDDAMTKGERDELAKLVRRREKLAKGDVDSVAANHLAAFEQDVAAIYHANDDEVWREALATAEEAAAEAQRKIEDRCNELGIREMFAPSIDVHWYSRGQNASKDRVSELRRVAKSRLDAAAKTAKVEIERASLAVQTELVASGLKSEQARAFLESMPTAEALMPALTVAEIEKAWGTARRQLYS